MLRSSAERKTQKSPVTALMPLLTEMETPSFFWFLINLMQECFA